MSVVEEEEENVECIYLFGGLSREGYAHSRVEEYVVENNTGRLYLKKQRHKDVVNSRVFRPLYAPFTFLFEGEIFFIGGEYG